ncbi:hypothetical protein, partial [uncultured Bifidobacterium sp.]|uniref:hypothetical protein n=1 Tax=uncultured Bifidobacterium sp. TaxID=165187 RepID=UPI00263788D6
DWINRPHPKPLHNLNIQPLEKTTHSVTNSTTRSSNHWRKTPTYRTVKEPKHPASGGKRTLNISPHNQNTQSMEKTSAYQPTKEPNHPGNGEDQPLRPCQHNRIIQAMDKNTHLPTD